MEEKAKQEKLEQIIDGHECEEEPLDLDELMDFEGGKEDIPIKACGLGCYLGGVKEIETGTQNGDAGTEA